MDSRPAPPSLADITVGQIMDSLSKIMNLKRKHSLHFQSTKSVFARAARAFTNRTRSTYLERRYLHSIWKSHTDQTNINADIVKIPKHLREKIKMRRRRLGNRTAAAEAQNRGSVSTLMKLDEESQEDPSPTTGPSASESLFNSLIQPKLEHSMNVDSKLGINFDETSTSIVKIEPIQDVEACYSDANEDELSTGTSPADLNGKLQLEEVTKTSEKTRVTKGKKKTYNKPLIRNPKPKPPKPELSLLRPRPYFPSPIFCFVCVRSLSDSTHPKVTSADCFCLVRDLLEMPGPQTQHYMEELKEPEKAIGLCDECRIVIREAASVKAKITRLEKSLKKCQRNIIQKIKGTALTANAHSKLGKTYHGDPALNKKKEQRSVVVKILKFVHNRNYRVGPRVNRTIPSRTTFRAPPCETAKKEDPTKPSQLSDDQDDDVDPPTIDPIVLEKLVAAVAALPPAPPLMPSEFLPKENKKLKGKRGRHKIRVLKMKIRHNPCNVKPHSSSSTPLGGLDSTNALPPSSNEISTIVKQEQDIEEDAMSDGDPLSVEDKVEDDDCLEGKLETIPTLPQTEFQINCGLKVKEANSDNRHEEGLQLKHKPNAK